MGELYAGLNGKAKKASAVYAGLNGVAKKVWPSDDGFYQEEGVSYVADLRCLNFTGEFGAEVSIPINSNCNWDGELHYAIYQADGSITDSGDVAAGSTYSGHTVSFWGENNSKIFDPEIIGEATIPCPPFAGATVTEGWLHVYGFSHGIFQYWDFLNEPADEGLPNKGPSDDGQPSVLYMFRSINCPIDATYLLLSSTGNRSMFCDCSAMLKPPRIIPFPDSGTTNVYQGLFSDAVGLLSTPLSLATFQNVDGKLGIVLPRNLPLLFDATNDFTRAPTLMLGNLASADPDTAVARMTKKPSLFLGPFGKCESYVTPLEFEYSTYYDYTFHMLPAYTFYQAFYKAATSTDGMFVSPCIFPIGYWGASAYGSAFNSAHVQEFVGIPLAINRPLGDDPSYGATTSVSNAGSSVFEDAFCKTTGLKTLGFAAGDRDFACDLYAFSSMFSESSVENVEVYNDGLFDTPRDSLKIRGTVNTLYEMFYNCTNLKKVPVIDLGEPTESQAIWMYRKCANVTQPAGFAISGMNTIPAIVFSSVFTGLAGGIEELKDYDAFEETETSLALFNPVHSRIGPQLSLASDPLTANLDGSGEVDVFGVYALKLNIPGQLRNHPLDPFIGCSFSTGDNQLVFRINDITGVLQGCGWSSLYAVVRFYDEDGNGFTTYGKNLEAYPAGSVSVDVPEGYTVDSDFKVTFLHNGYRITKMIDSYTYDPYSHEPDYYKIRPYAQRNTEMGY